MSAKNFLYIVLLWALVLGGLTYNGTKFYKEYSNQQAITEKASQQAQVLGVFEKIQNEIKTFLSGNIGDVNSTGTPKLIKLPVGKLSKMFSSSVQETSASTTTSAPAVIKPAPTPVATPPVIKIMTVESFMNGTNLNQRQRPDGTYWIQFSTDTGNGTILKWEPSVGQIGDGIKIPKLDVDFECNPVYDTVDVSIFSAYSFRINSKYGCDLSLKDKSGKVATKHFDFTTGPGLISVSTAAGTLGDTNLRENMNSRGIVFNNTDDSPVTITGVKFDISLIAVDPTKPAAIRFADADGNSLVDYFLESFATPGPNIATSSASNVTLNFSYTLLPHSYKMLMVQALGIHKIGVDVNPTLNITIKSVTTDRTISLSPLPIYVNWTCTPPKVGVDPNTNVSSNSCTY